MIKGRKWLILGLYILVAVVVFAYWLFPEETVKGYIAYQINAADPKMAVEIGSVKPSFPPGIKLKKVQVEHTGLRVAKAQYMTITPVYSTLLGSEKAFRFKANLYDGFAVGVVKLNQIKKGRSLRIDARLSGLNIGQMKVLEELVGRKISGTLDGEVKFNLMDGPSVVADANLELTEGEFELLMPVFTYKSVILKSVQADLALTNATLTVLHCDISGQPADGVIEGTIDFKRPVGKSELDLEGTVNPDPVFLALLRNSLPASMLPPTGGDTEGIGITFSGTLDAPMFAFN